MITLYFAEILDYSGKAILKLRYTSSAKHAAFLGNKFINEVPPAASFAIKKVNFSLSNVAEAMNFMYRG
jgi:hypothetical protein